MKTQGQIAFRITYVIIGGGLTSVEIYAKDMNWALRGIDLARGKTLLAHNVIFNKPNRIGWDHFASIADCDTYPNDFGI